MQIDEQRLEVAYRQAREQLLHLRTSNGYWRGSPGPSVRSTALAIVGLTLQQQDRNPPRPHDSLIAAGLAWVAERQQADGGWGDLPTSAVCRAAFQLADGNHPAGHCADGFLQKHGQGRQLASAIIAACGEDTFSAPLLLVCAAAGLIPWQAVPGQPFERTCVPANWGFVLRLPVIAKDLPSFVAAGWAVHEQRPTWNPLLRGLRWLLRGRALHVLQAMQAETGGFLGNVSATASVLACLAAAGQARHSISRDAVRFLTETVRPDGAWPEVVDDFGLWTPLAIDALTAEGPGATLERPAGLHSWVSQRRVMHRHPSLGEEPGGWAINEPPAAIPDGWHTAHALLALAQTASFVPDEQPQPSPRAVVRCNLADLPEAARIVAQLPRLPDLSWEVRSPVRDGLTWLRAAQNDDGGWPILPSLRPSHPLHDSIPEVTALALRALAAWQTQCDADQLYAQALAAGQQGNQLPGFPFPDVEPASAAGLAYLAAIQQADGAWPAREPGPSATLTTALVLGAFADLAALLAAPAVRGLAWLAATQNADGGWGNGPQSASRLRETAAVVRVLASAGSELGTAYQRGVAFLVTAVLEGRLTEATEHGSPLDILWHGDPLSLIIFTVAALGRARSRVSAPSATPEEA